MPYFRFVEPGRIAFIAQGKYRSKLCCIIDAINQKRVLVDGPLSKVPRMGMPTDRLHLTQFTVPITHKSTSRDVALAWKKYKVEKEWSKSRWAKKIESKRKLASLTDYERFQLQTALRKKKKIVTEEFIRLKKDYFRKLSYKKLNLSQKEIDTKEGNIKKKKLKKLKFVLSRIHKRKDLKKEKVKETKSA